MKSFCDMTFEEKCKIQDGEANEYDYSTGHTFAVKQAVREGIEKKEQSKG